jgi:hypothetical protein
MFGHANGDRDEIDIRVRRRKKRVVKSLRDSIVRSARFGGFHPGGGDRRHPHAIERLNGRNVGGRSPATANARTDNTNPNHTLVLLEPSVRLSTFNHGRLFFAITTALRHKQG